jgi:membrane fusion protein (multidrug efflux system)
LVEASAPTEAKLAQGITAVGTLRSDESVVVRPEVAGRVAEILFTEGQRVSRGQPLLRLDASVQRAEAEQARANLTFARTKHERAIDLQRKGFISAQALDEAQNGLKVADAALRLAEARLAKTEVRAPFSGLIGLRSVSVGDYVKEGQDVVNLEEIDPLKADFRVPEIYLSQVKTGLALQVTLDAAPDRTYDGRVLAINPLLDANGRAIVIRARVANPDGRLRPGMFARVRLLTDIKRSGVLIAEEALFPVGDDKYVYKVVDGRAQRQRVELGQRLGGKVEIVSGLTARDTVVTAGHFKLRDGMAVRTQAGAPKSETAAVPTPAKAQ